MKKLKLVSFAAAALIFASPATAQTGPLKGKDATVYNYNLTIADDLSIRAREILNNDGSIADLSTEKDPVVEVFVHKTYDKVIAAIGEQTGLNILPKDALTGKYLKDIYGYPAAGKKKAVKIGKTPYFLKVAVQITPRDIVSEEISVNGSKMIREKVKVHVFIKTLLLDKDGKTVFKTTGKAKADSWVYLEHISLFNGFLTIDNEVIEEGENANTMMAALDEAIDDLKTNLPE